MEIARKQEAKKREIPEEIIEEEILWRLPVKPLLRFRSVCKTWNSIIASDPNFAILQLKNSSTCFDHRKRVMLWDRLDLSSVFFLENKNQPFTSSNNNSEFAITKINTSPITVQGLILASCDGLVCIFDEVTNSILFWNPLTGETKRVSGPPGGIPPLTRLCICGLGYDSSTDDYKLVYINVAMAPPYEVGVFSLRTNTWRQIQGFPIIICSVLPGVYSNGSLYWTGCSMDSPKHLRCHVVSFCLQKEKYRLLDIPVTDYPAPNFRFGVQVLGDKLALHDASNVDGSYRLLLINPSETSESWTKHTITLPNDALFTPLCLLENVEEVLFQVNMNQFAVYRFRDGTIRHFQIIGLPKTFHTITFSESLISPNT